MQNLDIDIPLKDLSPIELARFRACNFLVNVLSNMYDQYSVWIKHHPLNPHGFIWDKVNACLITSDFHIEDWIFGDLIWSRFSLTDETGKIVLTGDEPFGCIVRHRDGGAYLVFRGSKSLKDFFADAQAKTIQYKVPTQNEVRHIYVEKGFYSVYEGMRDALRTQLTNILPLTKSLTITGHSLGSALATLAVPEAVSLGFNVKNYNTASPRVGLDSFKSYYDSLKVDNENVAGCLKTIRIVNEIDVVPTLPSKAQGYEHVGIAATFTANYPNPDKEVSESNNHNPCCSYGYAIYHPDEPLNPAFGLCCDPC